MSLNQHRRLHDEERLRTTRAVEGLRVRAHDAAQLMPGALLLLGFQISVVGTGALHRLLLPEQVALVASGVSVGLSVVLLALVARRRVPPARLDEQERGVRTTSALFLAGVGALAGGLAADAFVVTTRLTGWPGIGGLIGAGVLVIVCLPWF